MGGDHRALRSMESPRKLGPVLLVIALGCGKSTEDLVDSVPRFVDASGVEPSPVVCPARGNQQKETPGFVLQSREIEEIVFPGRCAFGPSLDAERSTRVAVDPCGDAVLLTGVCGSVGPVSAVVKLGSRLQSVWRIDLDDPSRSLAASLALDGAGSLAVGLGSTIGAGRLLTLGPDGQALASVVFSDGVDGTSAEEPSNLLVAPNGGLVGGLNPFFVYGVDSRLSEVWRRSVDPVTGFLGNNWLSDLEPRGHIGIVVLGQVLLNSDSMTRSLEPKSALAGPLFLDGRSWEGGFRFRFLVPGGYNYRASVVVPENDDFILASTEETSATALRYDATLDRFMPDPQVKSQVRMFRARTGDADAASQRPEYWSWTPPANVWIDEMLEQKDGDLIVAGTLLENQASRSLYVARLDPRGGHARFERMISVAEGGPKLNVRSYLSAALDPEGNLVVSTTTAQDHPWVGRIQL